MTLKGRVIQFSSVLGVSAREGEGEGFTQFSGRPTPMPGGQSLTSCLNWMTCALFLHEEFFFFFFFFPQVVF